MHYSIQAGHVAIEFDSKPSDKVRSILKGNGFRWNPRSKVWWRNRVAGAADVITAIDKALSPDRPDGDCWDCGNPGKFRPHGAAAPVLCQACHEARQSGNLTGAHLQQIQKGG